MRIKLDENVPVRAAAPLRALGHDVDTVVEENLGGHGDNEIWQAVQREGRFLVTQDLDFSDTRRFAPGTHHGLLLVRIPDSDQRRLTEHLAGWFAAPDCESWDRCLVVATAHKLRVSRPD
jgi:predicted nuclease of predicted toxin-antitoxin system